MSSSSDLLGTPNMSASRLSTLGIVMCGLLVLLISRLWFLQLEEGASFRERSERNRLRFQRIPAVRGKLYDRMGRPLVDNLPSFNVVFRPEYMPDLEQTLSDLARYLPDSKLVPAEGLLLRDPRRPADAGVVAARDVDWPTILAVESHPHDFPGVSIEARSKRSYSMGNLAAHLLGYVGEVSQRELDQSAHYRRGDIVGKFGAKKPGTGPCGDGAAGGRLRSMPAGNAWVRLKSCPLRPDTAWCSPSTLTCKNRSKTRWADNPARSLS